jgi:hypothetical protein
VENPLENVGTENVKTVELTNLNYYQKNDLNKVLGLTVHILHHFYCQLARTFAVLPKSYMLFLCLCLIFCRSLFFFDIRILIDPLVSPHFLYYHRIKHWW